MVALIKAAASCEHLVAALPYEGLVPMAIRTTFPHDDTQAFWQKLNASDPPLFKIIQRQPEVPMVDLDEHFSEEELTKSTFYREIMMSDGWRHIVALVFWNGTELTAHVGIWRTAEQGRFTDEEKSLLMAIHPHLEAAIRRVAKIARLEMVTSVISGALDRPSGDGIVLLDVQGKLVFKNHAAQVSCALWKSGRSAITEKMKPGESFEIPACIYQAAMDLLSRFLVEFRNKALANSDKFEIEIAHPGGEPVSANVKVIAPKSKPVRPHVIIEFSRFHKNNHGHANSVPIYRLSKSEHRVASLVASGMRNHDVAQEMGLSVNTVRAHLREVFSKLDVIHRGQLRDRLVSDQHNGDSNFDI